MSPFSQENNRNRTRLSQIKIGQSASVLDVQAGASASKRILDLGLCPGTMIRVTNSAPFDGPVEVSVRGTSVAIGRGLADRIFVEPEEQPPGPVSDS